MGLAHACVMGSLGSLAHRDLRQCWIASLGEREGICGRWWLSVMECVPNVKLIAKMNRIQCLIQLSKPHTGIFEVGRERSSGFCWLYWKRFRMEKLVLSEAETIWFFSASDTEALIKPRKTCFCRGACGVSAGRKFLFYIFYWGNSPCSKSLALQLMLFFFPSNEQTSSESLLLFQIPFITYLNRDLTRFFSGINYSWLHG